MASRDRFQEFLGSRLPVPFIPRRVDRTGVGDRGKAKMIIGPRQAGKSSLIWSWLWDRPPERLLFLNAEEALVQRWGASAAGMAADLAAEFPAVDTVFFEEAQHLENAGLLLKGLVDTGRSLDLLVTGSSSYHLMDRIRESLAGRAVRRVLLPLSLDEVCAGEMPAGPLAARAEREARARRMMIRGGYPAVWTSAEPRRELADLVESFVLRDASDRFRIRRPEAFRRLLQLAAGQVGQMVNLSEWAGLLGVSVSTVGEWLALLEETWILRLLPAFAAGRRLELTSAARVHFYDLGLRNALAGAFESDLARRADRGALMEGFVFGELVKNLPPDWTLHHWRSKGGAEVDFVLVRGARCLAVEVKAGGRGRLTRSARSFVEAYRPEVFLLVGRSGGADAEVGGTRVRFVDPWEVAPALAEALA